MEPATITDATTLTSEDIQTCIELACDGLNAHLNIENATGDKVNLNKQKTAQVIHKVMYALTEAAQSSITVVNKIETNQDGKFKVHLQVIQ